MIIRRNLNSLAGIRIKIICWRLTKNNLDINKSPKNVRAVPGFFVAHKTGQPYKFKWSVSFGLQYVRCFDLLLKCLPYYQQLILPYYRTFKLYFKSIQKRNTVVLLGKEISF